MISRVRGGELPRPLHVEFSACIATTTTSLASVQTRADTDARFKKVINEVGSQLIWGPVCRRRVTWNSGDYRRSDVTIRGQAWRTTVPVWWYSVNLSQNSCLEFTAYHRSRTIERIYSPNPPWVDPVTWSVKCKPGALCQNPGFGLVFFLTRRYRECERQSRHRPPPNPTVVKGLKEAKGSHSLMAVKGLICIIWPHRSEEARGGKWEHGGKGEHRSKTQVLQLRQNSC